MIGFEKQLVSKVLIFEEALAAQGQLKAFCSEQGLIGLKQVGHSAMKMLEANIDLGAVLISEGFVDQAEGITNGFDLARRVHHLRRELPIFMRRAGRVDLDDLTPEQKAGMPVPTISIARKPSSSCSTSTWRIPSTRFR